MRCLSLLRMFRGKLDVPYAACDRRNQDLVNVNISLILETFALQLKVFLLLFTKYYTVKIESRFSNIVLSQNLFLLHYGIIFKWTRPF